MVASTHNFINSQNFAMGMGGEKIPDVAACLRLSKTNSKGTFVNNAVTSRLISLPDTGPKIFLIFNQFSFDRNIWITDFVL